MKNQIENSGLQTLKAPVQFTGSTDTTTKLIDARGFKRLTWIIPVGAGAVDASHKCEFVATTGALANGTDQSEVSFYQNSTREDQSSWDKKLDLAGDAAHTYRIEIDLEREQRYHGLQAVPDAGFDTVVGIMAELSNPVNEPVSSVVDVISN